MRTPDILAELGRQRAGSDRPLLVGFAAETTDVVASARRKQREKGVDLVVANDVSRTDAGFEVDTNEVTLVSADGEETLPLQSEVGDRRAGHRSASRRCSLTRVRRSNVMSDHREQLAEHLKFFGELGVAGLPEGRGVGCASRVGELKSRRLSQQSRRSHRVRRVRESTESTRSTDVRASLSSPPSARTSATARGASCASSAASRLCSASAIPNADLMFVGEAPGRDEDIQGIPFVGRAGQKLTQIIEAIGLKRDDVYIANVIKCRPPENRNPEPDEVEQCEPFLFRQVDTIKPKVIVALGTFAAKSLLKIDRLHLAPARPRVRLSRREARADLPSGVSPAQSELPARGVGGHEEGPRASQRRRRGLIRCGWSPSPFPFPFSTFSRIRCPTASRLPPRGARVVVPLGKRVVTGIVVDPDATLEAGQTPPDKIKNILEVLDDEAFLPGTGGRSRAVGGGVLRVRRGRCPCRGRALDAGAQDDSHRDADRAGTRRSTIASTQGRQKEAARAAARRACTECQFPI